MRFAPAGKQDRIEQVRLHLASMIDVIFLLLIFFVVNTQFILPESHLDPNIQTQNDREIASAADFTPQVLTVESLDGRPAYRLGSRIVRDRKQLLPMLEALPKDLGIFVQIGDAVSVDFTVSAVQTCYDAGFEKITYVPKTP